MSKPNLLAFSTSVGFYRNRKVRDARLKIGKKISTKVDFRELTPMLFSVLMAYAAENQIDGDFADYTPEGFQEIFETNHLALTASQAQAVVDIFHEVELMEDNKIRSWKKFNRHLACYEQDKKAKIKAGKERQKQRAAHNGKHEPQGWPPSAEEQAAADRAAKVPANKVTYNGKAWPQTALQDLLKDVERQIEAKKKSKPTSDSGGSHNIWLSELNELEQEAAAMRSALRGKEVPPVVHTLKQRQQFEAPRRRDLMPVQEIDRIEDVDAERADLEGQLEAIENPADDFRADYYDGKRLKPRWEKRAAEIRERIGELSRRATALVGFSAA